MGLLLSSKLVNTMTAKDKTVEERIREHYTAQNGEWLVEKGKIKEAKLLKEACIKLENQSRILEKLLDEKRNKHWENYDKQSELEKREKLIAEREEKFEDRKASFIREFEKWV